MSDETQPEPITYLLRHSGCISGPTECCFEVAIQKALNMPLGTEVVELYEWPEELITRLRADLAAVTEERDALLAHLAPVDDATLVEIATREIFIERRSLAAAIAAIRPHIEAAEREWCAKRILEINWVDADPEDIAAAIRSGK